MNIAAKNVVYRLKRWCVFPRLMYSQFALTADAKIRASRFPLLRRLAVQILEQVILPRIHADQAVGSPEAANRSPAVCRKKRKNR